MRLIFDIDDTICTTKDRDYKNAIPNLPVIQKINYLYQEGFEIILYTSRGMVSCQGNLDLIIQKNEDILKTWLKENKVYYTKIIFGKPFGDLYIDDKAMNVQDFLSNDFYSLNGGSNLSIYKLGTIVKKEYKDLESLKNYILWTEEAKGICNYPSIISYHKNFLYYNYIEGLEAINQVNFDTLIKIIFQINLFKECKYENFDLNEHFIILDKNNCNELKEKIIFCKQKLMEKSQFFHEHASFSHGDCILSNIILKQNKIFFIDAQFNKKSSSYLLDFAKLNMSLDNYEYNFSLSKEKIDKKYKIFFENYLKEQNIYEEVKLLEYMYILRLYRYKKLPKEKEKVLLMLKKMEEEQGWMI